MKYDFHGVVIEIEASDPEIAARWSATFASRPAADRSPQIRFRLHRVTDVPPAPKGQPDFCQGDLLQYHLSGRHVIAHFPRYGQLRLNMNTGDIEGRIAPVALTAQGVFEDLVAIGLSPLLRRRGMYLLHAFAASPTDRRRGSCRGTARTSRWGAVLLVGDIGAGKTTTGLALLHAGWKLLSNDSPILRDRGAIEVLGYPGLLSAYPDSLDRFPELHRLIAAGDMRPPVSARRKIIFAAEDFYRDVWIDRAPAGAIIFPHIESRVDHALEPLAVPEALRLLLPYAVEQWDQEMIPDHLALLRKFAVGIPAFRLRLGRDSSLIPAALAPALTR